MPKGFAVAADKITLCCELLEKDISIRTVSDALGISTGTASKINSALRAAKDGTPLSRDTATLTDEALTLIYGRCGKEFARDGSPEAAVAAPADNSGIAVVKILSAITEMTEAIKAMTAAINAIDNRLSTMQMTQAGLRGDFGKEAQRVIEAIHVEGDIITKDQQKAVELLDGIRQNTKKRPWHGEEGQR